jgi:hypothetical protein
MADPRDPAEMPGPIRQAEIDHDRELAALLQEPYDPDEVTMDFYELPSRIRAGNADERYFEIPF